MVAPRMVMEGTLRDWTSASIRALSQATPTRCSRYPFELRLRRKWAQRDVLAGEQSSNHRRLLRPPICCR